MVRNPTAHPIKPILSLHDHVQGRHLLGQNRRRIPHPLDHPQIEFRHREIFRYSLLGRAEIFLGICSTRTAADSILVCWDEREVDCSHAGRDPFKQFRGIRLQSHVFRPASRQSNLKSINSIRFKRQNIVLDY